MKFNFIVLLIFGMFIGVLTLSNSENESITDKMLFAKGVVLDISGNRFLVASESEEISGNVWLTLTERTRFHGLINDRLLILNYVEVGVADFEPESMKAEAFYITVNKDTNK